eukprot:856719-Pleurochrysis_carterae.AAC.1
MLAELAQVLSSRDASHRACYLSVVPSMLSAPQGTRCVHIPRNATIPALSILLRPASPPLTSPLATVDSGFTTRPTPSRCSRSTSSAATARRDQSEPLVP